MLPIDVFVSYSHLDNKRGWVTDFCEDLEVRLGELLGRDANVWRDKKDLHPADRFDDEIREQLNKSEVMVAVLSPSYFKSEYCKLEHSYFSDMRPTANRTQVVKASKTPVDLKAYPAELAATNEIKFYKGPDSRELSRKSEGYYECIDDVAKAVTGILIPPVQPVERSKVFLAEATFDVEEQRNKIRRFFEQRNWDILPTRQLKTYGKEGEIRTAIKRDLAAAQVVIHPIGAHYDYLLRVQLEESRLDQRNGNLLRMIWIPKGNQPEDEPQRELLKEVHESWARNPFRILETLPQDPITEIEQLLSSKKSARLEASPPTAPCIYVICDRDDVQAAQKVRRWLAEQGFDVSEPPEAWDDPVKLREHLRNRLTDDDAFLIFHGASDNTWASTNAREVVRAQGLERKQPIAGRGLFLADPEREAKSRLIVQIPIYNGYSPTPLEEALAPFVADVLQNWGGGGE